MVGIKSHSEFKMYVLTSLTGQTGIEFLHLAARSIAIHQTHIYDTLRSHLKSLNQRLQSIKSQKFISKIRQKFTDIVLELRGIYCTRKLSVSLCYYGTA